MKAIKSKNDKQESIFNTLLSLLNLKEQDNSVQNTIPYNIMYKDGICKVTENFYTKTIQFFDITFQLAQEDDKRCIFENWCDFLNYFDSKISFQLSFLNQNVDIEEYKQSILIPPKDDTFNEVRKEYEEMLKEKLARGNNGIVKTKYITFSIEAGNLKIAKPRLERIETDILIRFKMLDVQAKALTGYERLSLLHKCFHENDNIKFNFSWDRLTKTGLSTKDFIAPNSFMFSKDGKYFKISDTWGKSSFLQVLASDLEDNILAKLLDLEGNMMINFHIKPVDQLEAVKFVKRKIMELDSMVIEEQKKVVRSGYDFDNIPNNIKINVTEVKEILEDLRNRNERLFLVTILITNTAKTKEQLENEIFQINGLMQQNNCMLRCLEYQQEQGLQSSLPIGLNKIEIQRTFITSSMAIFVPFTTTELFQTTKDALYYGSNASSNNLIMADRKLLTNPNGLILGVPGSGKSFTGKREIVDAFLRTDDDIIIVDPEGEYSDLVAALGGQTIELSPTSKNYVNPMDINLNYSDDDDPISLKCDFILSFCELITSGSSKELEGEERTIIDRCLGIVYRNYFENPIPENMPILEDLYNCLREQKERHARKIATALEFYVSGTMNVFNHRTNTDIKNRIVCYNIKGLGKNLKKIGLLIVQDAVWNRVSANRDLHKCTRYYVDELHLLLKDKQTAGFTVEIWSRFRKWGGMPTGITQNVKTLLSSPEIENIFENTDFYCLLKQAPGDREILAKKLNISPYQLSHITNTSPGEGLLIYGNAIIPFVDHFPKDTQLYKIMTTKLSEVKGG